jgi:1-acyl-sn-glycerol-3-phosphate acyltransferase
LLALLEPWRRLTSPRFVGLERIPRGEGPLLFVGNHTILGVLDTPLLVAEVYRSAGILLRGLGDHAHFKIPVWRDLLARMGAVDGTRENCDRLMREGEAVLVFPAAPRGGQAARREVPPDVEGAAGIRADALAHGCTVVPFAAVGAEDALDIVLDADDLMRSPLGAIIRKLGIRSDVVMPLVKGVGPTPLPRPERMYFHIGEPIRVVRAGGDDAARELRDRVKAAVEEGIEELLHLRARDPGRTAAREALLAEVLREVPRFGGPLAGPLRSACVLQP